MSLEYFPLTGRILLDDTGGHVIFDSDDEMLSVLPDDVKTGSQIVPARTAYSSGVDGTQVVVDIERDYPIATVEVPGARIVRGMMRVSSPSDPGPLEGVWVQATGTQVPVVDGVSSTTVPQSDTGGFTRVAVIRGFSLYVNDAGVLMLRERSVMRARDPGGPPASSRSMPQTTIEFRLMVGFFLGADFSPKPAISWVGSEGSITASTQFNGSIDFGPSFDGRVCMVGIITWNSTAAVSSVTIGGQSATIRTQSFPGYGSVHLASASGVTGSSPSVNVTMAGSVTYGRLFFFVGRNVVTFIGASASGTNATPLTASMDVSPGYAGIVLGSGFNTAKVGAMTGVSQFHNHSNFVGFFGLSPIGTTAGSVVASGVGNVSGATANLAFMAGFRFGV